MSDLAVVTIDAEDARRLTDRIKVGTEAIWQLVEEAYVSRAWAALGYSSWNDYCTREFGAGRIRIPREDREEIVCSMHDLGMSVRAIAAATGVSHESVRQSLPGVKKLTPAPAPDEPIQDEPIDAELVDLVAGMDEIVIDAELEPEPEVAREPETPPTRTTTTGTDGKTYQRPTTPAPSKQRRSSLVDTAQKAGWEFRKSIERMERIVTDDRFAANREQVADHLNDHLLYAIEVCQDLVQHMKGTSA